MIDKQCTTKGCFLEFVRLIGKKKLQISLTNYMLRSLLERDGIYIKLNISQLPSPRLAPVTPMTSTHSAA